MSPPPTLGCILAGGRGRRMGRDKAAVPLGGRPLVAHVVDRLRRQCDALVIAGPPTSPALQATGLPLLPDAAAGGLGPLAGILAGLWHARAASPPCPFVLTAPLDAPFLPLDLGARLHAGRGEAAVCVAASAGRRHFTTALWSTALADPMADRLAAGVRRVEDFVATQASARLDWSVGDGDPFENVNTPADLARAEARLRAG